MRSFPKPRRGVLVVVAATAVLAAGCVSQSSASGTKDAAGGKGDVTITLTPSGCRPEPASAPAGVVNFNVGNDGAGSVSEAELLSGGRMLGEQENLSPGLSGGFSLHLDNGRYQIYCPGAAREKFDFTVTGTATSSWRDDPALVKATKDYAAWITDQVGHLVTATQSFVDIIHGGDLSQAEVRYAAARVYYERVEPVAEIWGSLDLDIDGRLDDFDQPSDFRGFHKLERMIFQQRTLSGASGYADQLLANVKELRTLVGDATYQPAEIADGATSLVDEIQSSKVTGEEDRYSHVDLVDFQANLDGAQEAFAVLQPALAKTDPDLVSTVRDRYKAIVASLRPYQARPGYLDTGYVNYATVDPAARRVLSQVVNAYGEEMSKVAAKVA
ncbi:MAG TPA: iron uptake system protein EfeO [Pseudonocardiaceae bacterium]|nr:iron uptake system protein EfeO [Pseudonocardiaceae bacterium]